MKEFLVYTGLRLALFVASAAVVLGVWALVADEVPLIWVLLGAFVLSGIGSYFLLNRQREAFARRVDERARRMSSRLVEQEDAD